MCNNFLCHVKEMNHCALHNLSNLSVVKSSLVSHGDFELRSLYTAVCRKCIYQKLNDEELNHCPVCKIDLGCTPAEKLRYFSCDLSFKEFISPIIFFLSCNNDAMYFHLIRICRKQNVDMVYLDC
jgi:predicted Zn-ribbon and HTH transcriptional regulator